jgi:hypothetical protein
MKRKRRRKAGEGEITTRGHVMLSIRGTRIYEHIFKAERALGKPLPKGVLVHHLDGDGTNNDNTNLVICQNKAYHRLLHMRMWALHAERTVEQFLRRLDRALP